MSANKRARVETRSQTLWKNNDFTTFLRVMRGNPEMEASFRAGLVNPLFWEAKEGEWVALHVSENQPGPDAYLVMELDDDYTFSRDEIDPRGPVFKIPILSADAIRANGVNDLSHIPAFYEVHVTQPGNLIELFFYAADVELAHDDVEEIVNHVRYTSMTPNMYANITEMRVFPR